MQGNTSGYWNVAIGFGALADDSIGIDNTAVGVYAMGENLGSYNTATGFQALGGNGSTGQQNTADGFNALLGNFSGWNNTGSGYYALYNNITGNYNSALGAQALDSHVSGDYNTAVGSFALSGDSTGTQNTAIGYGAGVTKDGLTNATAIGARALVGASNSLVLGGTGAYSVSVGIGTQTPGNLLDIEGNNSKGVIKIVDGNQAAGKVLTSDANGNGSWQTVTGGSGGSGICTSAVVNQVAKFNTTTTVCNSIITDNGTDVGIGITNPTQLLDVAGNVEFSGALMPNNLPGNTTNILVSQGPNTSPIWKPHDTIYSAVVIDSVLVKTVHPTYTAVPGLSITFTTTAPAYIMITSNGTLGDKTGAAGVAGTVVRIQRTGFGFVTGGTQLKDIISGLTADNATDNWSISTFEILPAGTYTYSVQAAQDQSGGDSFYAGGNPAIPTAGLQDFGFLMIHVSYQ